MARATKDSQASQYSVKAVIYHRIIKINKLSTRRIFEKWPLTQNPFICQASIHACAYRNRRSHPLLTRRT